MSKNNLTKLPFTQGYGLGVQLDPAPPALFYAAPVPGPAPALLPGGSIATITNAVTVQVSVGEGNYATNLTITDTGSVIPSANGVTAVVVNGPVYYLLNQGQIVGAIGDSGLVGGIGVSLSAGTIQNTGSIAGGTASYSEDYGATGGAGVSISGGMVTNAAGGSISGGVGGSAFFGSGGGGDGAVLSGGTLVNAAGAIITGGAGGFTVTNSQSGNGGAGAYIDGGVLTNAGTIAGGAGGKDFLNNRPGAMGDAVQFGSAAGTLVIDPGAVFIGNVVAQYGHGDMLELAGSTAGTLSGLGIQFTGFDKIVEQSGANWTLTGQNTIGGTATVDGVLTVAGALDVTGHVTGGFTLSLATSSATVATGASVIATAYGTSAILIDAAGASLTNEGLIRGVTGETNTTIAGGIGVNVGSGTAFNSGAIYGGNGGYTLNTPQKGGTGATVGAGGVLTNAGTISGGLGGHSHYFHGGIGGVGVYLAGNATLTNESGGVISAGAGGPSDFYNSGPAGYGVVAAGGAYLLNEAGGSIGNGPLGEALYGVFLQGGTLMNEGLVTGDAALVMHGGLATNDGTIAATSGDGLVMEGGDFVNAGTLAGAFGTAALLLDGATLTVDPGAVFIGAVSADTNTNQTLILAGSSDATFTGLGSQFTGFDELVVNAGADWTLAGPASFSGAMELLGTLTVSNGVAIATSASSTSGVSLNDAAAMLSNDGSITGGASKTSAQAGAGVWLNAGTLINTGVITGGANSGGGWGGLGLLVGAGAYVDNSGTISAGAAAGSGGTGANVYGTLINTGLIEGSAGSIGNGVFLNGGTLTNAGTISYAPGGDAVLFGSNAGTLIVDPGAVFIGNVAANSGVDDVLQLGGTGTGTLTGLGSQFTGFSDLIETKGVDWILAGNSDLTGTATIDGELSLAGTFAVTGAVMMNAGATLDLVLGGPGNATPDQLDATGTIVLGGATLDVSLAAGFTPVYGESFTIVDDQGHDSIDGTFAGLGQGDILDIGGYEFVISYVDGNEVVLTDESAVCFCPGTLIRTERGDVAIEHLSIGDRVRTLHGQTAAIKWIGRSSYDGRFIKANHLILPVTIKAGALAAGIPSRDLHVSPGHGIYIDGVLVPAWRLVNGASITQADHVARVDYLNIELHTHDVIFAADVPVESFLDDDQRHRFHNAAEFAVLYPGPQPASLPCAPRAESGFPLHAIQQRLRDRAGLNYAANAPGALRGFLDLASPELITGWAQDELNPARPVCLELFAGTQRLMVLLANAYRADLRHAGLGSGCHAFEAKLPPGVTGRIEVRRAADGAVLPRTETALNSAAA